MTKYEWFKEFKNNLKDIPKEELNKAIEYYDELFEDKIDLGKTEIEIIDEFGSPSKASQNIKKEILYEKQEEDGFGVIYDKVKTESVNQDNTKTNNSQSNNFNKEKTSNTTVNNNKETASNGREILDAFLYVLLCIAVWFVAICAVVVMGGCLFGGAFKTIFSIISIFVNDIAFGFFNTGLGLIQVGIGIVLAAFIEKIIKFAINTTKTKYDEMIGRYKDEIGENR